MTDGTRTHDHRDHNPGLYQLSYSHHRVFIWRAWQDYSVPPVPHPSGRPMAVQLLLTNIFLIFALRASLWDVQFRSRRNCPDKVVKPSTVLVLNKQLLKETYFRFLLIIGAPGRTRTCYPRLRRPMLYPNELQAHI